MPINQINKAFKTTKKRPVWRYNLAGRFSYWDKFISISYSFMNFLYSYVFQV